jgi:crotonobetainyl-CoA:carnitine CoA-transferase CaiB-like acyl-CoA transferase
MTISGLALTRYLFLKTTADDKTRQTSTAIHGVYEADDGYVVLRATDERDLSTLAEVIGVEPEELGSNSGTLIDWMRGKTRREISDLLAEKVPCAPVLTDEELAEDPNVKEREMIVEKPHPLGFTYRAVATGIKFSETPVSVDTMPPDLGEHTEQVLSMLGYDKREMERLEEEKVIARKKTG